MTLWNLKTLEGPSLTTCKLEDVPPDLPRLTNLLAEAITTFSNQKYLEAEAALLSRFIYRSTLMFRSDKGLKELKKLNVALLRYLRMNYVKSLQDFAYLFPEKFKSGEYFPTRNLLDYVLVRTQGLAQLMCRALECTVSAALFLHARIRLGHMWKSTLVAFAMACRLHVLSKKLAKYACKVYDELLPLRESLKNHSDDWLTAQYDFPEKLDTWLSCELLFKEVEEFKVDERKFPVWFSYDSDVEECGEYIDLEIVRDVEIVSQYIQIKDDQDVVISDEDVGEPVSLIEDAVKLETSTSNVVISDDDIGEPISLETLKKEDKNANADGRHSHKSVELEITDEYIKIDDEDVTSSKIEKQSSKRNIATEKSAKFKCTEENYNRIMQNVASLATKKIAHPNALQIDRKKRKRRKKKSSDLNYDEAQSTNAKLVKETGKINKGAQSINAKNQQLPEAGKINKGKRSNMTKEIKSIKSIDELARFIKRDNVLRQSNSSKCKMGGMDRLQWNMLYKTVKAYVRKARRANDVKKSEVYLRKGIKMLCANLGCK